MRSELTLWKPFEGFFPLHREVDDIFSHFFGDWEWPIATGYNCDFLTEIKKFHCPPLPFWFEIWIFVKTI